MELKPIQIIIIDDHPWISKGLQQYLASCPDITVAGTAATADKGLELATTIHPDVAIVDLHLPPSIQDGPAPTVFSHGIHLISALRRQLPGIAILALTGFLTPEAGEAALRAGAHQCLEKRCEGPEIADAIQVISHQETPERQSSCPASIQSLTDRELEVLHLLRQGLGDRQIASHLSISRHTVNNHLRNIYSKLGVSRRIEATALAMDW